MKLKLSVKINGLNLNLFKVGWITFWKKLRKIKDFKIIYHKIDKYLLKIVCKNRISLKKYYLFLKLIKNVIFLRYDGYTL